MRILGISCFYHDSAATLTEKGEIIAAAQEERFSRIKNDKNFPLQSIKFCLKEASLKLEDLDAIVFYEKPFLKFERIIDSYFKNAPFSLVSFITSMPIWLKEKIFIKSNIRNSLKELDHNWKPKNTPLLFSEHHLSHAASTFYPSQFKKALILVIDGVGEYATTSIFQGENEKIDPLFEQHYPDSIGLLYSSITQFLGFEINNGEYKIMGLAPFAQNDSAIVANYVSKIKGQLIKILSDGSIKLNDKYFSYSRNLKMINQKAFESLFNIPIRKKNEKLNFNHAAIAQALQIVLEEIVFKIILFANSKFPNKNLCLAGGVALNCVLNGKIKESKLFDNIFIQPAAGDAGGSLGAALSVNYLHFNQKRFTNSGINKNFNPFLGPAYSKIEILRAIERNNLKFEFYDDLSLIEKLNQQLMKGKTVALFRGRMEFGPRALGNRSILANPLIDDIQLRLNLKIKKRESFRPFAPIILKEDFQKYFDQNYESPFMLFVHKLKKDFQFNNKIETDIFKYVQQKRSIFPGVTHVDYSSRIQTVTENSNSFLHQLLINFKEKSGVGILINTSFNIKDEPIVCTPEDAINCFKSTNLDILILDNFYILK